MLRHRCIANFVRSLPSVLHRCRSRIKHFASHHRRTQVSQIRLAKAQLIAIEKNVDFGVMINFQRKCPVHQQAIKVSGTELAKWASVTV